MDVGITESVISIEFTGKEFQRKTNYEKFLSDRIFLEPKIHGNWEWVAKHIDEKGNGCRLSTLTSVKITDKNDWPEIINFFKNRDNWYRQLLVCG